VAEVVESLLYKHEAPCSNPSPTQTIKEEGEEEERRRKKKKKS
jgi:hypothetical protein